MKVEISNYNHSACEKKWQKTWEEKQVFKFDENSSKEKYYVLEMLPYPSGKIHMGHLRNYSIGDALARFKKAQGYNVLHPMGFDAFGLPAENAALEHKIHPQKWTLSNIENMKGELKSIGLSYDWAREFATCLPDYYKHEQKIFLDFVKAGLAYQKESFVNWDPIDQTVLANEQVVDGRGWRSGALVEKKKLKQWFLKVSDFSEELLAELKSLTGWDERVLIMQEKWIGKSEGAVVEFKLSTNSPSTRALEHQSTINIFTTRPDTLFGASFVALSPHHPLAQEAAKNDKKLAEFIAECEKTAVNEAALETQEKKGIKTNLKVINPVDNQELEVWVANFVLMEYGTGAIFGCPAHDERDFEFAKKYNLPIKQVVEKEENFLKEDELIDFSNEQLQALIKDLKAKAKNPNDQIELAKIAFEFVRDEINHSMDDEKYLSQKPFLKASEVLQNKVGFCFGKSVLLCAILRGMKIKCGFSDQLLMFDETISERKIIHTVNAICLNNKWIRVDTRGNKPADVDAQFSLDEEKLAYQARDKFNEINNLGIYAEISKEALHLYKISKNNGEIIENLFAKINEPNSVNTEDGVMINSSFLDGKTTTEAKKFIIDYLEKNNLGKRQINFRLRDWGVSRQRYWGCPIPMLYLEDGSVVSVPEDQLPIELPQDVEFTGSGNPLANHPTWKYTTYKGQKAIRETDTFDTFFESSWYFLRYISQPENKAFERDVVNKFMPVDQYIGGIEHAVMHLLYARFFVKALKKCGYLDFDEPFKALLTQGMVCHQTFKNQKGKWVYASEAIKQEDGSFIHEKTGEKLIAGRSEKMSKSKKNVVEPIGIVESYGADVARLFMLSDTPPARDLDWSESGIDGAWRYVNRLWRLVLGCSGARVFGGVGVSKEHNITKLTHKTIAAVTEEYEKMGFNRAIAKIREFSNELEKFEPKTDEEKAVMKFALDNLVLLFAPIMPHLAEECWSALGNKGLVAEAEFPKFDLNLIVDTSVKIAVQVLGKLRAVIEVQKDLAKEELEKVALANENVHKFVEGKEIKKIIIVPNKLVNIVI